MSTPISVIRWLVKLTDERKTKGFLSAQEWAMYKILARSRGVRSFDT